MTPLSESFDTRVWREKKSAAPLRVRNTSHSDRRGVIYFLADELIVVVEIMVEE